MTTDTILSRFDDLNTWWQGDQRAPHKPLLVLYALGRWQQGKAEVTFKEAEPELIALLREFGPPRKSDHPEQPFLRLQRDGVWTVHAPASMSELPSCDEPALGIHAGGGPAACVCSSPSVAVWVWGFKGRHARSAYNAARPPDPGGGQRRRCRGCSVCPPRALLRAGGVRWGGGSSALPGGIGSGRRYACGPSRCLGCQALAACREVLKWPSLEDRFSAAMSLTRLDRGLVREAVPYVVDFYRQTKLSGNRAGIAELLGDADYPQYKTFMKRADRAFVLRTPARPDVTGAVSLSFYTQRSEGLREIEVVIPAEEFKRMEAGVAYTPAPVNGKPGFEWAVKDGVTVTKPAG